MKRNTLLYLRIVFYAAIIFTSFAISSLYSQSRFRNPITHPYKNILKNSESTLGLSIGLGISNAVSFSDPKSTEFLFTINTHINFGRNIFLLAGLDYAASYDQVLSIGLMPQYRFRIDGDEADLFLGAGGRVDLALRGGSLDGGADISVQPQYNINKHISSGLQLKYLIGGASPGYALMHISIYLKFNI